MLLLLLQRGLATARRAEGRAAAAAREERSAALKSDRAGLSREAVQADQAAELLQSAEEMLRAHPESHAARCSLAEVGCPAYKQPEEMQTIVVWRLLHVLFAALEKLCWFVLDAQCLAHAKQG